MLGNERNFVGWSSLGPIVGNKRPNSPRVAWDRGEFIEVHKHPKPRSGVKKKKVEDPLDKSEDAV